jgi:hypothetical protein
MGSDCRQLTHITFNDVFSHFGIHATEVANHDSERGPIVGIVAAVRLHQVQKSFSSTGRDRVMLPTVSDPSLSLEILQRTRDQLVSLNKPVKAH